MWIWPIAGTILLLVLAFIVRSVVEQSSRQTVSDNLQTILNADVAALNIWLEREESLAEVLANESRIQKLTNELVTIDQQNPDDREALLHSKTLAELRNEFKSEMEHLGYLDVIVIGLSQCIALIPGTSRSGITMTAARFIGMERPDAARFSMLLSIPTIIAAGTLSGIDIYKSGDITLQSDAFVAAGLSFIFALIAIALMMAWLKRASFLPFVVYRIGLGVFLLAVAYGLI